VTNNAEIILSGAGSQFRAFQGTGFVALEDSLTTNQGTLRILDNRDYTTSNDLTNSGLLQLGGGTLDANSLSNTDTGTLTGYGTVTPRPVNSGLIEATGGTLAMTGGIQGGSGTVTIQPDGALDLSSASQASSADFLNHQGTASDSLNLGSNDFIVSQDYTNANTGTGNDFDARANVVGTGQIVGENADMAITGDVAPAGANTVTLDLGNVRGGTSTTVNYQIENTGTGADIRGAVQTAAGTGNLTDARLSGTGVTAQNFGPIESGQDSGNLTVTFDATSGGALDGQTIGVVSNFDNVAGQTIQITGMATSLAEGSATPAGPIDLGNFRVGQDGVSQNFAVENTTSGPGAEKLGIGAATASGNFAATNNLGSGLIDGGASQTNALSATVNNGQAGVNTGALDIQYTTDGTHIDAGFTAQNVNTQSIALSATGYNMAQGNATPDPVTLANQRVGGSESQNLTVSNTAPSGTFTEGLNVEFGANTGEAVNNAGTIGLLAGGNSDGTSMNVGVDTTAAGARTGSVTLNYETDGTGTSGLAAESVGSQTISVSGNVFQVAEGNLNTTSLNFGVVQVGESVSQNLSISNIATGPSGFVEDLNAQFGAASGTGSNLISGSGTISGLLAGGTDTTSMVVNVNTASAGTVNGAIAVDYFSAGAVNGVSNGLGTLAVGSQDFGVTGTIQATATVVDQAAPVINTGQPILLGNVREGAVSPTAVVSVTNQATGNQQAALDATITGTAPITASGSFDDLGPGATDATSLQVGMNTATAGAISGTATIGFVSDAGNLGGGQLTLASQDVQVQGGVYRLAQGDTNPDPVAFGNLRINTTAEQTLTITNTAANDGYSEVLNAAFGTATGDAGDNAGAVNQLAAGGSDASSMVASLDTSVAGVRGGTVTVEYASDGTGTTGEAAISVGSQTISVSGNVFQVAEGNLNTTSLNFGVVQVGESVSQNLSISNIATGPSGFVEDLNAQFGAASGTGSNLISGSGTISGLLAGGTDTTSMVVNVNTASAGTVNGAIAVDYFSAGAVNGVSNGLGTLAVGSQDFGVTGTIQATATVVDQAAPVINTGQPILLGNVREGAVSPTAFVSVTNEATGNLQAGLNAAITGNAPVTASGSFDMLLPGGTDATSLQVGMNTATAGAIDGTATIAFVSDAGNHGGGQLNLASQDVQVQGAVYRLAQGAADPDPVVFGNLRINTTAEQALTINNTAANDGYSEVLNAAFGTATGDAGDNAGAVNQLAAGGSDASSMVASLDTSAAGVRDGTVTVEYASDGAGTTGEAAISVGSQNIDVTGTVYRLASPEVDTAQPVVLAARVGDAAPTQNLSVTNQSPDAFTEGLKADIGSVDAGFTGSGNIDNLAAGGTDTTSLTVGLADTSTSQNISGNVNLDFQSTGAGTTGAADIGVGSAAVAGAGPGLPAGRGPGGHPSVDFGIVHVGDVVGAQTVSVTNTAPSAALNDTLAGGFVNLPAGPFDGSGSVSGLGAGQTDAANLAIGLDTSSAGIFDLSGQYLQFASQNPDMADLDLGTLGLDLFAQVNNFANPVFDILSGPGSLTRTGDLFEFSLGTVLDTSGPFSIELGLFNDTTGPSDFLAGTFDFSLASSFGITGSQTFSGLDAGDFTSFVVDFNPMSLGLGFYSEMLTLSATGSNASGFSGTVQPGPAPERQRGPGSGAGHHGPAGPGSGPAGPGRSPGIPAAVGKIL
jgi:hypothetical protein